LVQVYKNVVTLYYWLRGYIMMDSKQ